MSGPRIIVVSGGVGGARLVSGLRKCIPAENLLIVANTADDFVHMGLPISPDLDTVMYTLAGLENPETGWGRRDETWNCRSALDVLCGQTWFQLGDRDLATHLFRAQMLNDGCTLTEVTKMLCARLGVEEQLVPMTDSAVRTMVDTDRGELSFQEYFVRERCEPVVNGFRFDGIENSRPASAIHAFCARRAVDAVVISPSNPFVSVAPVLAVPGMRELLLGLGAPVVAVSPIIGGRAVKGPAAKMLVELGYESSSTAVARYYAGFTTGFVIDDADEAQHPAIEALGLDVLVTDTLILEIAARERLASELLHWCLP